MYTLILVSSVNFGLIKVRKQDRKTGEQVHRIISSKKQVTTDPINIDKLSIMETGKQANDNKNADNRRIDEWKYRAREAERISILSRVKNQTRAKTAQVKESRNQLVDELSRYKDQRIRTKIIVPPFKRKFVMTSARR